MSSIPEAFSVALQYHQSGHLRQAEQIYRQILDADPNHADSLHLLGVACYQTGRYPEASKLIRQALAQNPWAGVYHSNLGVVCEALGQMDEALASFQEALRYQPNSPETHNAVGNSLRIVGRLEEAVAHCSQAIRLRAAFPEAHNNLGNALFLLQRIEEAVSHYEEALRLKPDYAEAHSNLGLVIADAGRREEAMAHYHEALRIKPDYADAYNNLSIALLREGRFEEAETESRQAIRLRPDYADAYNNLGSILLRQAKADEALAVYEKAMTLKPKFPEAQWNRSLLWLLRGNLEQGWTEYEWRWTQPGFTVRHPDKPLWDGADLHGRTILIYSEQGLGDTIHFIRYAPLLKQRGATVIAECQAPLMKLLAGVPGIDQLLPECDSPPPFDFRAPLLSLPRMFQTTLANVPSPVPYLQAEPKLVEHWRRELDGLDGFKVGIAWQGTPAFRYDKQRSIALERFAAFANVPGVRLISLQKGPGTDQLPTFTGRFDVLDPSSQLDEEAGPFMDTAAVIKNLDLVITSDTAIPHLAGALGVPVWVALAKVPDWRWLLDGDDCKWYPTMRLFRQTVRGQWDDVFERIVNELREVVARGGDHGSPVYAACREAVWPAV